MKKLALISSYCDTDEKLDILRKNCLLFKSLGVDTFVSSPIKIEVDCDFLFITKENPIISWPDKAISIFRVLPYQNKNLKLQPLISDSGWASLYQFKKMMEFAATFDYDMFYLTIYDLLIDNKIIEDIHGNIINTTYPRQDFNDKERIFPSSFHLTVLDKKYLKLMSGLILFEVYKQQDGFAEDFIEKWVNVLGLKKSKHVVSDLINIAPKNVFNLSSKPEYKFFINKDDNRKVCVFVWGFEKNLTIKLNESIFEVDENPKLVETDLKCNDIYYFSIIQGDTETDYSENYKKISRNILEFI